MSCNRGMFLEWIEMLSESWLVKASRSLLMCTAARSGRC